MHDSNEVVSLQSADMSPMDMTEEDLAKMEIAELHVQLHRLATLQAKASIAKDIVKVGAVADSIARVRKEATRRNRHALMGPFGKPVLPDINVPPGASEDQKLLIDMLSSSLVEAHTDFSLPRKNLAYIPRQISYLRDLQSLNLERCGLSRLPVEVFQLPFLRTAQLSWNSFTMLPPLSGSPLLEHLLVHSGKLMALPNDIGLLPLLSTLSVERNSLRALPLSLAKCKRLNHIDISYNQIHYVPPSLGELTHVSFFQLHGNPISNVPNDIRLRGASSIVNHLLEEFKKTKPLQTDVVKQMETLLTDEKFADIAFKPRGSTPILAHRVLIAARCPKLYSLVQKLELGLESGPSGEAKPPPQKDAKGRSIIPLNDMDAATFNCLKIWIYAGKFEVNSAPEKPKTSDGDGPESAFDKEREEQQAIAQVSRIISRMRKVCETYSIGGLHVALDEAQGIPKDSALSTRRPPVIAFEDSLRSLLNRSGLCDITFVVEDERFHAHRVILSARCEYFAAMFRVEMTESLTGEIVLPNVSKATIWSILVYCYRNELLISGEYAIELLSIARLYGIQKLALEVQEAIALSLDSDNIESIAQFAKENKFSLLDAACTQYIASGM